MRMDSACIIGQAITTLQQNMSQLQLITCNKQNQNPTFTPVDTCLVSEQVHTPLYHDTKLLNTVYLQRMVCLNMLRCVTM